MDSRFTNLLEPVSASSPCGEDLSFSSEFDRIQEARREDDPTVDYGEWQTTLKQADWNTVVECCSGLLRERSKDLRLSAWLTEGLVKMQGLRGLADGLEITGGLINCFGPMIHPQGEAGDQEQRIGNLSWLGARMAQLTRQIPITASRFSVNDYDSAQLLHTQLQRNPDAVNDAESRITLDKFSEAIAKTDKAHYGQWLADAERCRLALATLSKACDALFGLDGPSFSALSASVEAVHLRLQSIARDLGILNSGATADAGEYAPVQQELAVSPTGAAGPIRNRARALELLREVAAFFRNTEPHSPVAYLADKAAHWGAMPLHSWLRSVVKDHGTLSHIEELLGLEEQSR